MINLPKNKGNERHQCRNLLTCISLIAILLLSYTSVHNSGFINYDDDDYVTENGIVRQGITINGIWWAFAATSANNWHPLT